MRGAALVCATALCAAALTAAPAAAVPSVLTITATRSASMTVRVPAGATLDLDRMRITGGGELAGFLLVARSQPASGALRVRAEGWDPVLTPYSGPARLAGGSYTLRVAAFAPVTITVPVVGMARTTWRPKGSLRVSKAVPAWTVPVGPVVTASAPVTATTGTFLAVVTRFAATGAGEDETLCLTAGPARCDGAVWDARTHHLGTGVASPRGTAILAHTLPPGAWNLRWLIEARGVVTEPEATAYVIG